MTAAILTVNAGSSSIKAALYPLGDGLVPDTPLVRVHLSGLGAAPVIGMTRPGGAAGAVRPVPVQDHEAAIDAVFDLLAPLADQHELIAVGHRVVHGGRDFTGPVILDEENLAALATLSPLAPGHQPHNLGAVYAARRRWPGVPQTASFDTAFHATCPPVARQFALPRDLLEDGILRYGFHGLSYDYIAGVLPAFLEPPQRGRVIVAHLGAGASMCALKGGISIATTMGMTALDGLPMGTRCGDLDPGVVLYLLEEKGMTPAALADCLYHHSGLLGLSGISGDMRTLEASRAPAARAAVDYFVYRCGREIGSLAAALGGLDAFVFTGGIGEHSAGIREAILANAGWLGFDADERANGALAVSGRAGCITTAGAQPSAWVVPTDEELVIARQARTLITA